MTLLLVAKILPRRRSLVVASRVRRNTLTVPSLIRFLGTRGVSRSSRASSARQNHERSTELGLGVHEMEELSTPVPVTPDFAAGRRPRLGHRVPAGGNAERVAVRCRRGLATYFVF